MKRRQQVLSQHPGIRRAHLQVLGLLEIPPAEPVVVQGYHGANGLRVEAHEADAALREMSGILYRSTLNELRDLLPDDDREPQLLENLALQSSFIGLPWLNLPSGKFPQVRAPSSRQEIPETRSLDSLAKNCANDTNR